MAGLIVKWAFLQHLKPVQRSVDPVGILSEKQMAFGILEGFWKNFKAMIVRKQKITRPSPLDAQKVKNRHTYAAIICHNDELSLSLTWLEIVCRLVFW